MVCKSPPNHTIGCPSEQPRFESYREFLGRDYSRLAEYIPAKPCDIGTCNCYEMGKLSGANTVLREYLRQYATSNAISYTTKWWSHIVLTEFFELFLIKK